MNQEIDQQESAAPRLTLFVTGDAPRSRRARVNLKAALQTVGFDPADLLVIDLVEQPEQSIKRSIFATPALMLMRGDGSIDATYGDLSDEEKLLDFLSPLAH